MDKVIGCLVLWILGSALAAWGWKRFHDHLRRLEDY